MMWVDPRELVLPANRQDGPSPEKLARQLGEFGRHVHDVPALLVTEAKNGALVLNDGVTRAVRVAMVSPSAPVPVDVINRRPWFDVSAYRRVRDVL